MAEAINIILDESKHPNVYFVEIKNDDGVPIKIGKRISSDGLTKLRITKEDIKDIECKGDWARHIKKTDKFL